jgi:hypothetical protein
LENFATLKDTFLDGSFSHIAEDKADQVAALLWARGYKVERADNFEVLVASRAAMAASRRWHAQAAIVSETSAIGLRKQKIGKRRQAAAQNFLHMKRVGRVVAD